VLPRRLVLVLLALATLPGGPARAADAPPPFEWEAVPRVVAVGDVHGDLGPLETVLQDAGLVDAKGRWSGGRAHLVQTGDRVDRGPDSRKVMDLLMRLEKDARKAGGAVHALVGNHEVMNVLGILRYTIPEEFAAFRRPDSEKLRQALFARLDEDRARKDLPPLSLEERRQRDEQHPPGFVEHRLAFSPNGRYGGWISRQNTVIRIGDTLFLHGGIGPKYADMPLLTINERVRQEVREADAQLALVSRDADGPLWFRGLAEEDPALLPHLEELLRRHGCRRMVIGHTVTPGLVLPRYGGKVVQIDVGLGKAFGGPPAALLLEDGRAFALHRGHRIALPEGPGEGLLRYAREIAALEPPGSPVAQLADALAEKVTAAPAAP
jgi:hypothetical protein